MGVHHQAKCHLESNALMRAGAHHEAERAAGAGGQAECEQAHQRLVEGNVRQRGRAKQELSCLCRPRMWSFLYMLT